MSHFTLKKFLARTDEFEIAWGFSELVGEDTMCIRWLTKAAQSALSFPATEKGQSLWFPLPPLVIQLVVKYVEGKIKYELEAREVDSAFRKILEDGSNTGKTMQA